MFAEPEGLPDGFKFFWKARTSAPPFRGEPYAVQLLQENQRVGISRLLPVAFPEAMLKSGMGHHALDIGGHAVQESASG
jgi:hypothetical protein